VSGREVSSAACGSSRAPRRRPTRKPARSRSRSLSRGGAASLPTWSLPSGRRRSARDFPLHARDQRRPRRPVRRAPAGGLQDRGWNRSLARRRARQSAATASRSALCARGGGVGRQHVPTADGSTQLWIARQVRPGAASAGPASPTTWSRTWPGATRRPRRQVGGRTLRGETGGSLPLPLQRRHGKVGYRGSRPLRRSFRNSSR
jgi:hypothetical protein